MQAVFVGGGKVAQTSCLKFFKSGSPPNNKCLFYRIQFRVGQHKGIPQAAGYQPRGCKRRNDYIIAQMDQQPLCHIDEQGHSLNQESVRARMDYGHLN